MIGLTTSTAVSAITCKDNNNNSLTAVVNEAARDIVFWGFAVSGATSYIVSWTTSAKSSLCIVEYSGVSAIGATNTSTATSTTASVAVTTTANNSWVVAQFGNGGVNTYSASVGNLRVQQGGGSGAANTEAFNDNSGGASGSSVTNTCTCGSTTWFGLGIELQPTVSATSNGSLLLMGVGT